MHDQLRRRLIGAVILVSLGVIFIPMILDRTPQTAILAGSPVPPKPGQHFEPIDIPLEPPPPAPRPTSELIDRARQEAEQAQAAAAEAAANPAPAPAPSQQGTIARGTPAPTPASRPQPSTPMPAEAPRPAPAESRPAPAPVPPPALPAPPPGRGESWIVQVGSFSSADNAQKLKDKLRGVGFPAFVERVTAQEGTAYKVRVGPMVEKGDAETTRAKLQERMNLSGIVVRYQ